MSILSNPANFTTPQIVTFDLSGWTAITSATFTRIGVVSSFTGTAYFEEVLVGSFRQDVSPAVMGNGAVSGTCVALGALLSAIQAAAGGTLTVTLRVHVPTTGSGTDTITSGFTLVVTGTPAGPGTLEASLIAVGSISADLVGPMPTEADLVAVAYLSGTLANIGPKVGAASLGGIAVITAMPSVYPVLESALAGIGQLQARGKLSIHGASALVGVADITAGGRVDYFGSAALAGIADSLGTLDPTGSSPLLQIGGIAIVWGLGQLIVPGSGSAPGTITLPDLVSTLPEGLTHPDGKLLASSSVVTQSLPIAGAQNLTGGTWNVIYTVPNSISYAASVRIVINGDVGPAHTLPQGAGVSQFTDGIPMSAATLRQMNRRAGKNAAITVQMFPLPPGSTPAAWQLNAVWLTFNTFSTALANAWAFTSKEAQALAAWIGLDGAVHAAASSGLAGTIGNGQGSGNGWITPVQIAPYGDDVNAGIFTNGTIYLTYTANNADDSAPSSVYRVSRIDTPAHLADYGAETPVPATFDTSGDPTGGPYQLFIDSESITRCVTSPSAGNGLETFLRSRNRLFGLTRRTMNHSSGVIGSVVEDGSHWAQMISGPFPEFQEGIIENGAPIQTRGDHNEELDGLKGYQVSRLHRNGYDVMFPSDFQVGQPLSLLTYKSPIVRLGDKTLAQLVFSSAYVRVRDLNLNSWTWNNLGTQTSVSQNVSFTVPSYPNLYDATYSLRFNERSGSVVAGVFDVQSGRPNSVKFTVPTLRYPPSFAPGSPAFEFPYQAFVRYDSLTFGGCNASQIVIGTGGLEFEDGRLDEFGGSSMLFGQGSVLNLNTDDSLGPLASRWNNPDDAGQLWINQLAAQDVYDLVAGAGKKVTLPISYDGPFSTLSLGGVSLIIWDPYDDSIFSNGGNYAQPGDTWISATAQSLSNPTTPSSFGFVNAATNYEIALPYYLTCDGGGNDPDTQMPTPFMQAVIASMGSSFAATLSLNTTRHPYGFSAPNYLVNITDAKVLLTYSDPLPDFRLIVSRDDGETWEYAADAATIPQIAAVRDWMNAQMNWPDWTEGNELPLMPQLIADQHLLHVCWIQNNLPVQATSQDLGQTWQ